MTLAPKKRSSTPIRPSRRRSGTDASRQAESRVPTFPPQVFDRFPALIWRSDAHAKCDYFNQTWLDFTGRTLEQELGDGWADGVHADDLARCLRDYLRAFHARRSFVLEYRLRRHDGKYRRVLDHGSACYESDGRFAGYIGSCLDVTDLRDAEQQVRFQASLLDQVRNAVIATDLEGKITYWNRYAEKLYLWRAGDAVGRSVLDLVVPKPRREEANAIRAAIAKKGHWSGEFEVRRKDGGRFVAEVHDTLIADEHGAPIGVVGVSTDVSARKRVEKRLRDSQEQLRALMVRMQQIKEDESTRIAREIHDELGQALSGLGMDLNWMHRQLVGGTRTKREGGLRRRLEGMRTRLETTVLAVQRIATELRPGMLDDFGLAATLEWQAEEFTARTGLACKWLQRPTATISDYGRATALFRIFQEILTNVARHAHARVVTLQLLQTKREVILEVVDDGKGFRLGLLMGRAALGLLGMHERAARMGGRMKIDTAPGKGTKITVVAPVRSPSRGRNSKKGGMHGATNQDSRRG